MSLLLSLVNTILGIIIGVITFVNVDSSSNFIMLIVAILTILLDVYTFYDIYKLFHPPEKNLGGDKTNKSLVPRGTMKIIGNTVSKQPYTIGVITILLPAVFKIYTIWRLTDLPLFGKGKPETMSNTVYHQIIGLNVGCLIALLLMFYVNRRDIQENKKKRMENIAHGTSSNNGASTTKIGSGMARLITALPR